MPAQALCLNPTPCQLADQLWFPTTSKLGPGIVHDPHTPLQVDNNSFLYISANIINTQSFVAAHVRLGALTALSGSDSKWAAQRDECLASASSWASQWQCAALLHARCAQEVALAEPE